MKCLFIGSQPEVLNLFSFILSSEYAYLTYHAMTVEQAVDQFEMEEFGMAIYTISADSPLPLFDMFKVKGIKIPVIFTGSLESISDCHQYIDHHPLVGKVSYQADERVVSSAIKRILGANDRAKLQSQGYCPIELPFFKLNNSVDCDVFLKLSDEKYVRVFHAKSKNLSEELDNLHSRGVEFLYMKHEDYLATTGSFMQNIREKINVKKAHHKSLNYLAKFGHASVCRLVSEFGLKKEVLRVAESSLKLIQTVVAKRTRLSELVKSVMEGKDYRSEHTLLLVYISCAMAREVQWKSGETAQKITMAAFFHDICVEDKDLEISMAEDPRNMNRYEKARLTKYMNHPFKASELLGQVPGIPMGVDKIIELHHEKPDGSGFPHGVDWTKIFPLAAVMIVAEDFVDAVYNGGKTTEFIDDLLDDYDLKYKRGNFKQAVQGLRKALGRPAQELNFQERYKKGG